MLPQLLLTKRLFGEASVYADRADPVSCGIAISMLQDAAELYIWTLVKERNLTTKDQAGFVSNIETLQKAGVTVPYAAKLLELNKARIGFKHYGNLPAPEEARKHHTYVEDFLRSAMLEHFAIKFDDLSLVDLIADAEIKQHLQAAEKQFQLGSFRECVEDLAKAKVTLFGKLNRYVPKVDSCLRDTDRILNRIDGVNNVNSFAYLAEYLGTIRETSLVALLRLPLNDYNFLRTNLPSASKTVGGTWYMNHNRSQYSEAECRRASTCIINLCVRLEQIA